MSLSELKHLSEKEILLTCPKCKIENSVYQWDKVGKIRWMGYTSIYSLIQRENKLFCCEFKCPSCGNIVEGVELSPYQEMKNNLDALRLLKRKD